MGHCLSIFFDLNDYNFTFFDNDESNWIVYWNDEIQKKFYFYKYNNWSFYKFKIVAGKDNISFYIDENEAEICVY